MSKNIFFKKKNIKIKSIYPKINIKNNFLINDIKTLDKAKKNDITFFDSSKYSSIARQTRASLCITTSRLEKFLPSSINKVIVKKVLFELAIILKKLYPYADIDYPDLSLKKPNKRKYSSVKFGNNVLIGNNVRNEYYYWLKYNN